MILCIVPARLNSKGLKKKNVKKINNYELFSYPLRAAAKSKLVDAVVITSESDYILNLSKKYNPDFIIKRPKELSKDTTSTFDVLRHSISFLKKRNINPDYIICLEPTSPLTTSRDIDSALTKLLQNKNADSIISVAEMGRHHLFNVYEKKGKYIKNYLTNKPKQLRRQALKKLYYIDGSLYASKLKSLLKYRSFVGGITLPYFVNKKKSFEIDDIIDFKIVSMFLNDR